MKTKLITTTLCVLVLTMAVLAILAPAYASTTYENTDQDVNQRQWRSRWHTLGTYVDIDDSGPYYTYTVVGKALLEKISYSPSVTDQEGGNFAYAYDKDSGHYILHAGVISYTSPYSGFTISEVWSGWYSFHEKLFTADNDYATEGQQNQWCFTYGDETTVKSAYPYAVDMGNGWWLTGFSTYTFGSTSPPDATYPGGEFWQLALNPPHLP